MAKGDGSWKVRLEYAIFEIDDRGFIMHPKSWGERIFENSYETMELAVQAVEEKNFGTEYIILPIARTYYHIED